MGQKWKQHKNNLKRFPLRKIDNKLISKRTKGGQYQLYLKKLKFIFYPKSLLNEPLERLWDNI